MSNTTNLVPLAESAAQKATTATTLTSVLTRVQEIKSNPGLSFGHKRILLGQEVATLLATRKNECEAREGIQRMKLAADTEMVRRAIDVYKTRVIYEIDDEFNKFMGKLGIRVNMAKLGLLQDLAEKLVAFKRAIPVEKLERRYVKALFEDIERTFDDVRAQLGRAAAEAVIRAQGAQGV